LSNICRALMEEKMNLGHAEENNADITA
jgi:hypothetical protein